MKALRQSLARGPLSRQESRFLTDLAALHLGVVRVRDSRGAKRLRPLPILP